MKSLKSDIRNLQKFSLEDKINYVLKHQHPLQLFEDNIKRLNTDSLNKSDIDIINSCAELVSILKKIKGLSPTKAQFNEFLNIKNNHKFTTFNSRINNILSLKEDDDIENFKEKSTFNVDHIGITSNYFASESSKLEINVCSQLATDCAKPFRAFRNGYQTQYSKQLTSCINIDEVDKFFLSSRCRAYILNQLCHRAYYFNKEKIKIYIEKEFEVFKMEESKKAKKAKKQNMASNDSNQKKPSNKKSMYGKLNTYIQKVLYVVTAPFKFIYNSIMKFLKALFRLVVFTVGLILYPFKSIYFSFRNRFAKNSFNYKEKPTPSGTFEKQTPQKPKKPLKISYEEIIGSPTSSNREEISKELQTKEFIMEMVGENNFVQKHVQSIKALYYFYQKCLNPVKPFCRNTITGMNEKFTEFTDKFFDEENILDNQQIKSCCKDFISTVLNVLNCPTSEMIDDPLSLCSQLLASYRNICLALDNGELSERIMQVIGDINDVREELSAQDKLGLN